MFFFSYVVEKMSEVKEIKIKFIEIMKLGQIVRNKYLA